MKKLPNYNTLALIFGVIIANGRNGCEISDMEDFQNDFYDDEITGEKVTTLASEDAQPIDHDHVCLDQSTNFTRTKRTQSIDQDKRVGKKPFSKQKTLAYSPKKLETLVEIS